MSESKPRKCRVCGCTDTDCSQCIAAQGHPCWWVEDDLCSRCADDKAYIKKLIENMRSIVILDNVGLDPGPAVTVEHKLWELTETADRLESMVEKIEQLEAKLAKAEVLNDFYIEGLEKSEAKIEQLKDALLQHRADLHQGSKRPCPTCRKSAEVLGLNVPDRCARADLDKQALKEKAGN